MAYYDNLPLNTPTKVAEDAQVEIWATRTSNPPVGGDGNVEYRPKGQANQQTMQAGLVGALARIRQIKTQATAFANQADYTTANLVSVTGAVDYAIPSLAGVTGAADYATANLAALNDLLHKAQLVAGDVNTATANQNDLLHKAQLVAAAVNATTANSNDLLHKSQSIATAVGDLADDIRYLARLAANQLDATT